MKTNESSKETLYTLHLLLKIRPFQELLGDLRDGCKTIESTLFLFHLVKLVSVYIYRFFFFNNKKILNYWSDTRA